jgi:hypothetical protein
VWGLLGLWDVGEGRRLTGEVVHDSGDVFHACRESDGKVIH